MVDGINVIVLERRRGEPCFEIRTPWAGVDHFRHELGFFGRIQGMIVMRTPGQGKSHAKESQYRAHRGKIRTLAFKNLTRLEMSPLLANEFNVKAVSIRGL